MYHFNIGKIHRPCCPGLPTIQNHGPMFPPPSHRPTPFYIAARTSPTIELSFIIQGMKGETLPFPVSTTDLAFILEQNLKRKGWKDKTIQRSVLGFLETPMIQVREMGGEGEIGILEKNQ